jgi:mono/diheme cytochrome c family protein
MIDFVSEGSVNGAGYGRQGQGSGKMPGFGALLTDEQIEAIVEYVRGL